MSSSAYKLSFPCPECGGVLTMSVKSGEGDCPLCNRSITVNLDIQVKTTESGQTLHKRGWDSRAFRRPATANKPMWQPFHQTAE